MTNEKSTRTRHRDNCRSLPALDFVQSVRAALVAVCGPMGERGGGRCGGQAMRFGTGSLARGRRTDWPSASGRQPHPASSFNFQCGQKRMERRSYAKYQRSTINPAALEFTFPAGQQTTDQRIMPELAGSNPVRRVAMSGCSEVI